MKTSFTVGRGVFAVLMTFALLLLPGRPLGAHASGHLAVDCAEGWAAQNCTEVEDAANTFGSYYVGHDEPATLFYSGQPGSGNTMQYQLTLPKDPPTPPAQADSNTAYNFQLHPAFWFGMAMCDTQSYPEQVSTCTPDSDTNIKNNPDPSAPDAMAKHAGTAFMEMQFYPPGWVLWPAGDSCDATKWCAALNIDSLSEDPVNGTVLNNACQKLVGIEYVNFAFITLDGTSQAPANPVQATNETYTPDPSRDMFMNSGDRLTVSMHDTAHGLAITVRDLTTHQTGSMTASAANGFGQVQYATNGSTCNNIPYDFHPMYSTSSEATRVIWAAHSYNISFSDEIGHFDYCNGTSPSIKFGGPCPTGYTEGSSTDTEASDGDDTYCFPAAASPGVQVSGCLGTNTPGFDGTAYQRVWPDGDTVHHPTPIRFTSPLTDGANYSRVAFEADLPRIEAADLGGSCNRTTGAGCTNPPNTDDGAPVSFYPFYSITGGTSCNWLIGDDVPGLTANDFGKTAEYGPLLRSTYLSYGGGGTTLQRYNNYRQVLSSNPCPVG